MSIVLDSGALIALERNDKPMWAALKLAALENENVLVPSAALAQVWRGSARQARLSSALEFCVLASFDAVARDSAKFHKRYPMIVGPTPR